MVLCSSESGSTERKELESFFEFMKTLLPDDKYQCVFDEIVLQYSRVEPILQKRGTNFVAFINKRRENLKNGKEGPNKALYKVKQHLDKAQESERENLMSTDGILPRSNSETRSNDAVTILDTTDASRSKSESKIAQSDGALVPESVSSSENAVNSTSQVPDMVQKPNEPAEALKDAKNEKQKNTTSPCKRKLFLSEIQIEDKAPKAKVGKTDISDASPEKPLEKPQNATIEKQKPGSDEPSQDNAPGPLVSQSDQLLAIDEDDDYSKYDEKFMGNIIKLENCLIKLKREIDKLESSEMDWEEMDVSYSNYLLVEQYKKKGYLIYKKLQQLKKKPWTLHRKQYKMIKYTGSQYSVLNNMITSLINKDIDAPDFAEVLDTVKKFNDQHFKFLNVENATQKIFREVVILFKKRRCYDLKDVFANKQIDLMQLKNDPANANKDLQSKLKENKLLCKDEKEILQQFTEASELALKLCNVDIGKVPKSLIEEKFPDAASLLVRDKCYFLCFGKKLHLEECLKSLKEKPVEIEGKNVEVERVQLAGGQNVEESSEEVSNEDDDEVSESDETNENERGGKKTKKEEPLPKTTVENAEFLSDIEDNVGRSDAELDIFGFPLRSCTKSAPEISTKVQETAKTAGESVDSIEEFSKVETNSSMSQSSNTATPTEATSVTATSDKIENLDSAAKDQSQLDSQSASTISQSNKIEKNKVVEKSSSSSSKAFIVLDDNDDDDIICLDD